MQENVVEKNVEQQLQKLNNKYRLNINVIATFWQIKGENKNG